MSGSNSTYNKSNIQEDLTKCINVGSFADLSLLKFMLLQYEKHSCVVCGIINGYGGLKCCYNCKDCYNYEKIDIFR